MSQPPRLPRYALTAATAAGIAAGLAARLAGQPGWADLLWAATTTLVLLPSVLTVLAELRRGHVGVDLIALLAMTGSLILDEHLAGAVIALMLAGGEALEELASRRARRELTALVSRTPRVVHRYRGEVLETAPIDTVAPGDRLLVKPGEVVPVDGRVEGGGAVLDESAMTGESRPVSHRAGDPVMSGTVNAAAIPLVLRATATASRSTYAAIVRLVQEAQAAKAPLVRLADRYALVFLPLTLLVAAAAWLASGEPIRALAVLVVATPCPLILAAPVALVAGISRAARGGVIVKGGGALEALARGRVLVLDKTGTVTRGAPVLTAIETVGDLSGLELLRLAASLDLVSPHVLAAAIVRAAQERELPLQFPTEVEEELGAGIRGQVGGRTVALGNTPWVLSGAPLPPWLKRLHRRSLLDGSSAVCVAVDGQVTGALVFEDPIRTDAPQTLRRLRRAGFERILLLTGDHRDVAEVVGSALGVDGVLAERTPAEKVDAVREARAAGITVMVGDGLNDAPALAAADVGVALGARGATASSEAADVVLLVDRLDRLGDAVAIARRSRRIALESIAAGMGLSLLAMVVAAVGLLPPVAGAMVQEVIDVAVIGNALRALGGRRRSAGPAAAATGARVREEHRALLPRLAELRQVADRLDRMEPARARGELEGLRSFLLEELLPHERAEDARLYPEVARLLGGQDPTGTMSRAHLEIARLVRTFDRLLQDLPASGPDAHDLRDLRRVLYGLHAILQLHFAQEEESFLPLVE